VCGVYLCVCVCVDRWLGNGGERQRVRDVFVEVHEISEDVRGMAVSRVTQPEGGPKHLFIIKTRYKVAFAKLGAFLFLSKHCIVSYRNRASKKCDCQSDSLTNHLAGVFGSNQDDEKSGAAKPETIPEVNAPAQTRDTIRRQSRG